MQKISKFVLPLLMGAMMQSGYAVSFDMPNDLYAGQEYTFDVTVAAKYNQDSQWRFHDEEVITVQNIPRAEFKTLFNDSMKSRGTGIRTYVSISLVLKRNGEALPLVGCSNIDLRSRQNALIYMNNTGACVIN